MDESLALAITHLRWFRGTYEIGEVIDPRSGLTAADLDRVFEALRMPPQSAVAPPLTFIDLDDRG